MPQQNPSTEAFASIAPKFASLSRDVLFGDVWQRIELSPRERSLVTVTALAALYRLEQLPVHLARAAGNGLTRADMAEAFTHLAFYAGWPCAASALQLLRDLPDAEGGQ